MKISEVIAALERLKKAHRDHTCADEAPLGLLPIRYVEAKQVPQYRAFPEIVDGETVVLIHGQ